MFTRSIREGVGRVWKRFRLVLLIYIVNLLSAFVLMLPVYYALRSAVSTSGFSTDLTRGFDFVLWADILESAGATLGSILMQIPWVLPVFLVWNVASTVGLIHALSSESTDGSNRFWLGVGRYTGRALLLATLFLIPSVILCGLVLLLSFGVHTSVWPGEVGGFWIYAVFAPLLLLLVLAIFNLMHDYGRIALLVENRSVNRAWRTGVAWPFKHRTALWLYTFWFLIGALFLMLPTLLGMNVSTETIGTVWLIFLLQQLVLLARGWVKATWIGSEVAFFEGVQEREASANRLTSVPTPAFTLAANSILTTAITPTPLPDTSASNSEVTREKQAIEHRASTENTTTVEIEQHTSET